MRASPALALSKAAGVANDSDYSEPFGTDEQDDDLFDALAA